MTELQEILKNQRKILKFLQNAKVWTKAKKADLTKQVKSIVKETTEFSKTHTIQKKPTVKYYYCYKFVKSLNSKNTPVKLLAKYAKNLYKELRSIRKYYKCRNRKDLIKYMRKDDQFDLMAFIDTSLLKNFSDYLEEMTTNMIGTEVTDSETKFYKDCAKAFFKDYKSN